MSSVCRTLPAVSKAPNVELNCVYKPSVLVSTQFSTWTRNVGEQTLYLSWQWSSNWMKNHCDVATIPGWRSESRIKFGQPVHDKWIVAASVGYHARNTATQWAHVTKARIEAIEDRDRGFDGLELAELVELGGGALLSEGSVDVEESPPTEGLGVDETVVLGSLETVAPPWIATLEI